MAYRKRRQLSLPDHRHRQAPNNVDHLAFKYMMCKVESSSDSDSEISPRWSDTSTMGCVSSTPESGSFRRTLPLTHKPAGRHGCYSLFLDPYDGSSEDSDESDINVGVSSRRTRQQGKSGGGGSCRFSGRSRRLILQHPASVALREVVKIGMRDPLKEQQHLLDVQMKSGCESERCVCELDSPPAHSDREGCTEPTEGIANDLTMHSQTMDIELHCQYDDSGLHVSRSPTPNTPEPLTPVEGSSTQMLYSSSDRPSCPCDVGSLYKRKLGFPQAGEVELEQRKRQCIVSMEGGEGKHSEPCWSNLTKD